MIHPLGIPPMIMPTPERLSTARETSACCLKRVLERGPQCRTHVPTPERLSFARGEISSCYACLTNKIRFSSSASSLSSSSGRSTTTSTQGSVGIVHTCGQTSVPSHPEGLGRASQHLRGYRSLPGAKSASEQLACLARTEAMGPTMDSWIPKMNETRVLHGTGWERR